MEDKIKIENSGSISISADVEYNIANNKSVYFLGIGGIGMSALARYFKSIGYKVSGYDKTETHLTNILQQEGIDIHFTDDILLADTNASIIVYTPALPSDNVEINYFKENGYHLFKRSEVLGFIAKAGISICVAGTHGKTTTSAMLAHLFTISGIGCNAFLGGISTNYNTNFLSSNSGNYVVEADEYDRSFLKLYPNIAIITTMDADHLDIYGTEKNMQDSFIQFASQIKDEGLLIIKKGIKRIDEFSADRKIIYHLTDETADAYAKNIRIKNSAYYFDAIINERIIEDIELNMGGVHNIENALAAISVACSMEMNDDEIKEGIKTFRGVKRRFEYQIKNEKLIMIDDYAHHPEELRALIESAKNLFPNKHVAIIFQPHLFSRTRDLAREFAEVLSIADEAIVLPIYPAREKPINGVSSNLILENLKNISRDFSEKTLLEYLKQASVELFSNTVLITAGAGDIDKLVTPIKEILESKFNTEFDKTK